MPREIKSLLSKIRDDKVNIIAKSVGTRVAMTLAPKIPKQINKKKSKLSKNPEATINILFPPTSKSFWNKKEKGTLFVAK